MKKTKRLTTTVPYEVDIIPNEHGGYYARVPDFPTIITGGSTPAEAMRNALAAIQLMVEEYQDRGLALPKPRTAFSGHFNVRVPKALHRDLHRRAESEGVSLNALIAFLLAEGAQPASTESRGNRRRRPRAEASGKRRAG